MGDSEAVKDGQLPVGEGRSKAASMGVSRGRGKRGRGGRRVGERGRGGAGRGGRGQVRGQRGTRNRTMKVNAGSLEFSASSSSSNLPFIFECFYGEQHTKSHGMVQTIFFFTCMHAHKSLRYEM